MNHAFFSEVGTWDLIKLFVAGLRFDVSVVVLLNSIFIILSVLPLPFREHKNYQLSLKMLFVLINSIAYLAICVDFAFFRFTMKRTTADIFDILILGNDTVTLIPQFLKDFWYLFLCWMLFIAFTIVGWNRIKLKIEKPRYNLKYYVKQSLQFFIVLFITIVLFRGGFQLKPISIITAGTYTSSENVPLVLNTPFTICNTLFQPRVKEISYYKDTNVLNRIFTPIIQYNKAIPFTNKNVVVIILESFSWEYVGSLNPSLENGTYKGYTPFLDSLIKKSMLLKCYANGKRSIEGIPAVLSGLPSLMNNPYITSNYSGNKINSLASLLKAKGYNSSFFHGGSNGTMGFDAFVKMAGFDSYYGRSEYNNETDYDGKWGIYDEPFLQYFAQKLNTFKQPFVSSLFTLSSHHPYNVPKELVGKFPKGTLDIHKSIGYADYSLRRFFETAQKMPWFSNTIFVLTADHTSEAYYDFFKTNLGMYQIPLIIFSPKNDLPQPCSNIAQQSDIMPSVLDLLNYDKPFVSYGKSVFDSTYKGFSMSYMNEMFQLITPEYLLEFDGQNTVGFYELQKDSLLQNNIYQNKSLEKSKMQGFVKAYIQQYINRMIRNQLTID
ncbi:MAG: LTA synthase family protein [Bacteroidota bacterium]